MSDSLGRQLQPLRSIFILFISDIFWNSLQSPQGLRVRSPVGMYMAKYSYKCLYSSFILNNTVVIKGFFISFFKYNIKFIVTNWIYWWCSLEQTGFHVLCYTIKFFFIVVEMENSKNYRSDETIKSSNLTLFQYYTIVTIPILYNTFPILQSSNPTLFQSYTLPIFKSYNLPILQSSNPTLFQSYNHSSNPTPFQSYTLPILHPSNPTLFQS